MGESDSGSAAAQAPRQSRDSSPGGRPRPPGVRNPDPTLGRIRPVEPPKATVERVPGVPAHHRGADIDPPTKPKRQRVVLADPAAPASATALRGRVELAEHTSWGEMLIKDLIRAQLRTGLAFGALVLLLGAGLPLAFALVPAMSGLIVAGVPIAWLLLGILSFPLLTVIGLWHHRIAERHERAFVDMIEN